LSTLDFGDLPAGHRYTVKLDPEEADGERRVRLANDMLVFLLAVGSVIVIAAICVMTVLNPAAGQEEKKWAMSIRSAATGGLVGYFGTKIAIEHRPLCQIARRFSGFVKATKPARLSRTPRGR
jgi:hypothetical protein